MTDEQDFAWAFHEEKYKDALGLTKDISDFLSRPADTPSELEIQKRRLRDAGSRLDEILSELREDTSVPRQMINEIGARRDAAELVEPPPHQVVYAPAPAPAQQSVMVQVVLVTAPAFTPAPEPSPAREEVVVEPTPPPTTPEAQEEQVQAAPASAEQDKSVQTRQRARTKITLEDFLMPYLVNVFRSGTYGSGKELYKALVNKAGADDSPFRAGTGRTDALYVTKRGQTLANGTLNKWMHRVREEAAG